MSAAHHVEAAIIGAGVIGLATARALAMSGKEVLILEKASTIGSGISSRNSEVIHAGIYYRPNSLKATLCVKGRHAIYQYCDRRDIAYQKMGKLIVASNEYQLGNDLPSLEERARTNNVEDLRLLSAEDVRVNFEEDLVCRGALFSPSTGVLDSHNFMISLLADAEECGATLALRSRVDKLSVTTSGIVIHAQDLDITCDNVVNCAGLHAHQIQSWLLHGARSTNVKRNVWNPQDENEMEREVTRQFYAKGSYFKLQGQTCPFRHLVYPIPTSGGLGVHVTIDLSGTVKFGPDVEWMDVGEDDPDNIDTKVNVSRSDLFYDEIRNYWPTLRDDALVPDYCGIRPKIGHPDLLDGPSVNSDFWIRGPDSHGIKGFVTMLGMESPGLTASMAIADLVGNMLQHDS